MNDGLTKTELALLEALQRERVLLQQRDWVSGIILHELSNAATVVTGSADLINMVPSGSPAFASSLKHLQRGATTLRQLLAGLRVLIDSTGTPLTFEAVDVVGFVGELAADPLLMGGEEKRVVLQARGPVRAWRISTGLLRHALGNVLRNALRYGENSSKVSVIIGQRESLQWIHVLNRGPRIPAEVVARLFEPGRKSSSGGMGLGLYIAQTCADRLGGRLVFGTTSKCTVFSIVWEKHHGANLAEISRASDLAS